MPNRKGRKSSTRLSPPITKMILNFKKKQNCYSVIGTPGWGNELYDYVKYTGGAQVIREDIDRWIGAYEWISEPIKDVHEPMIMPVPIYGSRSGAENFQNHATGVKNFPGTSSSQHGHGNSKTDPSQQKRLEEDDYDVFVKRNTNLNTNPKLQQLAVGFWKLNELIEWLDKQPALKPCLMDTTKIFNRLQEEQRKSILGG